MIYYANTNKQEMNCLSWKGILDCRCEKYKCKYIVCKEYAKFECLEWEGLTNVRIISPRGTMDGAFDGFTGSVLLRIIDS